MSYNSKDHISFLWEKKITDVMIQKTMAVTTTERKRWAYSACRSNSDHLKELCNTILVSAGNTVQRLNNFPKVLQLTVEPCSTEFTHVLRALVNSVNLTQVKVTWEEKPSNEKVPPSD